MIVEGELVSFRRFYYPLAFRFSDVVEKGCKADCRFFPWSSVTGVEQVVKHVEFVEAPEISLNASSADKKLRQKQGKHTLVFASQKWIGDYYKADAKKWGYIEPERWNRFYRWLNESSLMPGTLPENKGFTNDFLN